MFEVYDPLTGTVQAEYPTKEKADHFANTSNISWNKIKFLVRPKVSQPAEEQMVSLDLGVLELPASKANEVWALMYQSTDPGHTGWKLLSVHSSFNAAQAAAKPMEERNEHYLIDGPIKVED